MPITVKNLVLFGQPVPLSDWKVGCWENMCAYVRGRWTAGDVAGIFNAIHQGSTSMTQWSHDDELAELKAFRGPKGIFEQACNFRWWCTLV